MFSSHGREKVVMVVYNTGGLGGYFFEPNNSGSR